MTDLFGIHHDSFLGGFYLLSRGTLPNPLLDKKTMYTVSYTLHQFHCMPRE